MHAARGGMFDFTTAVVRREGRDQQVDAGIQHLVEVNICVAATLRGESVSSLTVPAAAADELHPLAERLDRIRVPRTDTATTEQSDAQLCHSLSPNSSTACSSPGSPWSRRAKSSGAWPKGAP